MNKKILSCALVAAMLASSVSAMSVSAVDKDAEAYTGSFKDGSTVQSLDTTSDGASLPENFSFEKLEDIEDFSKDTVYIYDYKANAAEGASLSAVQNAYEDGDTATFAKEMANYFQNGTPAAGLTPETGADLQNISVTRQELLSDFKAVLDAASDLDLSYYDKDEVEAFSAVTLVSDIKAKKSDYYSDTNSELAYYVYEYNKIFGENGLLAPASSVEDTYETWVEKVGELNEEDYSSVNWTIIQNRVALAESYAADDNYAKAVNILKSIFVSNDEGKAVETKAPSYSDLRDALKGLFTEAGLSDFEAEVAKVVKNTSTAADYEVDKIAVYAGDDEKKANYLKKDYTTKNDTDAWDAFAGVGDDDTEDSYVAGAYREALKVYALCTKSATRKYVAQSTVDNALNNLNEAILALDPNYETPNWIVVKLEDLLEKANEVNEDDYRTTSSYWKNFVNAKEDVEKLLEQDSVKEATGEAYYKKLSEAMDKLSGARKAIPSETKTDLKDAMTEAKALLKKQDGKTATQIKNLEDALEAADDVYGATGKLISEYETATADLNKAITAYKQAQGWYKDANGTWYYGKEGTVAKGWLNVNGIWYLLDDTTGAMKTGWQQVNGTWYYMDASGAMKTGWLNLNGTYYYLESWGGMATGWKNVNGSWYYLQGSGAMVANGWYWINGKCYYFYNWGGMAANTTIDGYTVDASGAWVK